MVLLEITKILFSPISSHKFFVVDIIAIHFPLVYFTNCCTLTWWWEMYIITLSININHNCLFLHNFIHFFASSLRWIVLTLLPPSTHTCLVIHLSFLEKLLLFSRWVLVFIILIILSVFHIMIFILVASGFDINQTIGLF